MSKNLHEQVRTVLDASTQNLDELTLARLRAARLRALGSPPPPLYRWAPAWAVASLLLGVLWLNLPPPTLQVAVLDDLELLTAAEDPALYTEDWEFYAWLAEQAPDAAPDAG